MLQPPSKAEDIIKLRSQSACKLCSTLQKHLQTFNWQTNRKMVYSSHWIDYLTEAHNKSKKNFKIDFGFGCWSCHGNVTSLLAEVHMCRKQPRVDGRIPSLSIPVSRCCPHSWEHSLHGLTSGISDSSMGWKQLKGTGGVSQWSTTSLFQTYKLQPGSKDSSCFLPYLSSCFPWSALITDFQPANSHSYPLRNSTADLAKRRHVHLLQIPFFCY